MESSKSPNPDQDLEAMSNEEVLETARRLRQAIRAHRDATGHQLCWYVPELWDLLPDKVTPTPQVPSREEFLRCCGQYHSTLPEPDAP